MVFDSRPEKSLFFILFVFIFTISAQKIVEPGRVETSEADFAAKEKFIEKEALFIREKENLPVIKEDLELKTDNQTEPAADYLLKRGAKEFQLEFGVSPFNPSNFAGPKEYDVYGRDLYLANFRIGRVIGTRGRVTYQYLFGATPLALFTKNEVANPVYVSATATPNVAPTKREITYGVGIQPVNFRFVFLPRRRLKPYAQVGAGLLFTNKPVPVPVSRTINLTGDFGGGVMYMLTEKRAVNFGYKYFHISNGNIGGKINNPGYNANVFSVTYSFFWK